MPDAPSTPIAVLFIDDDPDVVAAARLLLERRGMAFAAAASPEAAWIALAQRRPDVILLDLNFARSQTDGAVGLELLARLLLADPTAAVVVVTGHSGVAVAVAAMRGGAADFLMKPWNNEKLVDTIAKAANLSRARRGAADSRPEPTPILGESPAMVAVRALVAKVARSRAAVLVHGPPGTGKTLVAHALHAGTGAPLTVIDARDAGETLDARLANANEGTLLIEDVDALAPTAQARVARGLASDRTIRPIATTRVALDELRAGHGLDDALLFALATVEIALPPLPERPGDARLLAAHYLRLLAARYGQAPRPLESDAALAIDADPWPGGVRQLIAACERAVVLGEGDTHTLAHFALSAPASAPQPRAIATSLNLAQSERALVEAALKRNAYNVSRAAEALGLTRAALYRRMDKHGL